MYFEEKIMRLYLQASHDRGGGFEMAMRMMARRMLVLEDRLFRSGVDFPTDTTGQDATALTELARLGQEYDAAPPAAKET